MYIKQFLVSLKYREIGIIRGKVKHELRVQIYELINSNPRVMSSNIRVASSNPRVRRLKARVARLKALVGRLKA